MSKRNAYPCPNCQIGSCQPGLSTYTLVHEGMLVSLPDMPTWTCDICQYQEYDPERLRVLDILLGLDDSALEPERTSLKVTPAEPADPVEPTTIRRVKHDR